MKKYVQLITIVFVCSMLLIACSGNDTNAENNAQDDPESESETTDIPEELILDANADPIELENQMELEIGDTGYTVAFLSDQALAITLNGVEKTHKFGQETREGDDFYLIGDFTFQNLGDDNLTVEEPDAAKVSDTEAIENDEFTSKEEMVGIGAFPNPNPMTLEPGEEVDQKLGLAMTGTSSDYMVFFGLDDGSNKHYWNKVAWIIDENQMEEIESQKSFQTNE